MGSKESPIPPPPSSLSISSPPIDKQVSIVPLKSEQDLKLGRISRLLQRSDGILSATQQLTGSFVNTDNKKIVKNVSNLFTNVFNLNKNQMTQTDTPTANPNNISTDSIRYTSIQTANTSTTRGQSPVKQIFTSVKNYTTSQQIQNIAESHQTERQHRELDTHMQTNESNSPVVGDTDTQMSGNPNIIQQDSSDNMDLGETTFYPQSSTSSDIRSASVPSFADGLPQQQPLIQDTQFTTVDQLVSQMNELTMGHSQLQQGTLRLSMDQQQPIQQQQYQQQIEPTQPEPDFYTQPQTQTQVSQLQEQLLLLQQQVLAQNRILQEQLVSPESSYEDSRVEDTSGVYFHTHYVQQQQQLQQQYHQQQQQSQQQPQTHPTQPYPPPPQQPVAESGAGPSGSRTGLRTGPTLRQDNVKLDKPFRFGGKHSELDNFIFKMKSYLESVELKGQNASRYLVSYLEKDALTWWRSYCETHGGLSQVFQNKDLDDIIDDLTTQFTDIDDKMQTLNRLFALKQTTSVQAYTSMFRHLQCQLGTQKLDSNTAMHVYLHGLKYAVASQVFIQRPNSLEDLILLAERCDQAHMAFRGGNNNNNNNNNNRNYQPQRNHNNNRNNNQPRGGNNRQNYNNRPQHQNWRQNPNRNNPAITYQNVSQYGNHQYKGPAPMALGALDSNTVCYGCGQQGHIRRNCPAVRGGGGGRGGPRGGGNPRGGYNNMLNFAQHNTRGPTTAGPHGAFGPPSNNGAFGPPSNAGAHGPPSNENLNYDDVMRLGMAAVRNQNRQRSNSQGRNVQFQETVVYNDGAFGPTKN